MYFICHSFLLCIIIYAPMFNLRSFLPLFHFSYTEEQKFIDYHFQTSPIIEFSLQYHITLMTMGTRPLREATLSLYGAIGYY